MDLNLVRLQLLEKYPNVSNPTIFKGFPTLFISSEPLIYLLKKLNKLYLITGLTAREVADPITAVEIFIDLLEPISKFKQQVVDLLEFYGIDCKIVYQESQNSFEIVGTIGKYYFEIFFFNGNGSVLINHLPFGRLDRNKQWPEQFKKIMESTVAYKWLKANYLSRELLDYSQSGLVELVIGIINLSTELLLK